MSERTVFNFLNPEGGIPRELTDGMATNIFFGDNVMISLVRCEPHAKGSLHSHAEEQWGIMLEGSGKRIQGDETFEVKKGDFWKTPGGTEHTFEAGEEGAFVIDIFSPPRDDYRTAGSGFGKK